MRKFIGKNVLGMFIMLLVFVISGCSQPTNQKDSLDPEEQKRIEEEKKIAEEQKKKEELITAAKNLVVGKTFKQIDKFSITNTDNYNFVADGDIYIFYEDLITIKTSKGNLSIDFSPFNIKSIEYKKRNKNDNFNTYEIFLVDNSLILYILDKPLFEIRINGYINQNIDGKGALVWDGTDSNNDNDDSNNDTTDYTAFLSGDWNYTAFIANQNRDCTVSFNNGSVTSNWVNTTVTGTYTINNSILHIDFTRTQSGISVDYEGDFNIEKINDSSFKLSAGNYLEAFAMFFGVTSDSITFNK